MYPNQNQPNSGQPQYQPQPQPSYGPPPPQPAQQPFQSPNYGPAPGTPQQSYDTLPTPTPVSHPSGHNPYEFIVNPNTPKHKSLSGDKFIRQVLFGLIALAVLFGLGGLAANKLIPNKNAGPTMILLVQEQHELARISRLAPVKAKSQATKNLAVNTLSSMTTAQNETVTYLGKAGIKVGEKALLGKQDSKTDALFTTAQTTSTFDETFKSTVTAQLTAYTKDIQMAYKETSSATTKKLLAKNYKAATLLLKQAAAS